MDNKIKQIIQEQVAKTINERKRYHKTRAIVESIVRDVISKRLRESKSKQTQLQQALNDPSINKSGLARKIEGLSGNDDTRRSEISKIARGEWIPDTSIQNDILHTLATVN